MIGSALRRARGIHGRVERLGRLVRGVFVVIACASTLTCSRTSGHPNTGSQSASLCGASKEYRSCMAGAIDVERKAYRDCYITRVTAETDKYPT